MSLLRGELVSGSVVTHLESALLQQTADNHELVQISSLTRAVAAVENTEVMSPGFISFIMGIWGFSDLTITIKTWVFCRLVAVFLEWIYLKLTTLGKK